MHDPVLARLVQDVDAATAALKAYVAGSSPSEADDLVSLKDAEREFDRSNDTLRRWASQEGLGELVEGRWHIRRSMVRQFKRA